MSITIPADRDVRPYTYAFLQDAPATAEWIVRWEWGGVRNMICWALNRGVPQPLCTEYTPGLLPNIEFGRWKHQDIEVRHCSYPGGPADSWLQVRHADAPHDEPWVGVEMPRDWNGRCHFFSRLVHERVAFDNGCLPIAPAKLTCLDVQDAVEATYQEQGVAA